MDSFGLLILSGLGNQFSYLPFLTFTQKDMDKGIIEDAEGSGAGLISGKKLFRSAVRLGVGGGAGYLFGKGGYFTGNASSCYQTA